jgi:redox-regulated HSP33 family molecular chaperone
MPGCSTRNDSLPESGTEEDYLARRENSATHTVMVRTTCAKRMTRIVSRPIGIQHRSTSVALLARMPACNFFCACEEHRIAHVLAGAAEEHFRGILVTRGEPIARPHLILLIRRESL